MHNQTSINITQGRVKWGERMVINGQIMSLADCMVRTKHRLSDQKQPQKQPNNTDTGEFVWVAYDNTRAKLPVAIAPTAEILARLVGCSVNTIHSVWSKYQHGKLNTAKYAKVYIGGD